MKNNSNSINTRNLFLGLVLSIICTAGESAWTAPADSKKATSAVQGWLKTHKKPLNEIVGNSVLRVESFKDATGNIAYHIVYLKPSGFVIVSADDLMEPIVGFAATGVFDPSDKNPLGAIVGRDLPARMAWAKKSVAASNKATLQAAADWNKFTLAAANNLQANYVNSVTDVRVAPFVVTTWGQTTTAYGQPSYNYYTPPYEAGNVDNYPCGCVATAMAQIMRYFQYPTVGVGTQSFNIGVDGKTQSRRLRGGDGSGGPYNWANMPINPLDANSDVGALAADAGVAIGMSYTAEGSESTLLNAQNALINTFHYTAATYGQAGFGCGLATSDLITMINPNLDARLPVMLGIVRDGGAHAIVVDGYGYSGSTLYHHLNMGWDGVCTAWYNLPTIDTAVGYTYYLMQDCLYNVYTNGTGEIISGRILDQNSQPVAAATVTATRVSGGTWTATTDAKGIYALPHLPSKAQYTIYASKDNYNSFTGTYSTGASVTYGSASGNIWGADFSLSNQPKVIDHFGWVINKTPPIGTPFTVTLTALDKNNVKADFAGTVNLSASTSTAISSRIIGDLGRHQTGWRYGGSTTLGYTFMPNTDLLVSAFRTLFGTKVSIWDNSGTLLASQSVTNKGSSVVETPLSTPITLKGGDEYTIGVYCPDGTYPDTRGTGWPLPFRNGYIFDDAFGAGDVYPAERSPRDLTMVDLSYTCHEINAIAITPTVSGTFANGIWTGDLTLLQSASNIVLRADDGAGHFGTYGFNVEIPQLTFAQASLDFGNVTIGENAFRTFTLTNTGSGILCGTVTAKDPFNVVSGSPFSIAGGQTGAVNVAFNPTAVTTYNGQIFFTSNCGEVTNTVTGAGIAAPMTSHPMISISVTNNDVFIRFMSITNQQYAVQRSAVLPFADIVTVRNVSGADSWIEVKDANAVATNSASFYRVLQQ